MKAMSNQSSPDKSPVRVDPCLSSNFKADNVCVPGNTLLWDLLQDDKIVSKIFFSLIIVVIIQVYEWSF